METNLHGLVKLGCTNTNCNKILDDSLATKDLLSLAFPVDATIPKKAFEI